MVIWQLPPEKGYWDALYHHITSHPQEPTRLMKQDMESSPQTAPLLTVAIWDLLKSCIADSPQGLSFRFTFIFSVAEAARSQLVQRSWVEEERGCGQRWSSDGWPWNQQTFPACILVYRGGGALRHSPCCIPWPKLDWRHWSTEHEIWITSAPYWQRVNIQHLQIQQQGKWWLNGVLEVKDRTLERVGSHKGLAQSSSVTHHG